MEEEAPVAVTAAGAAVADIDVATGNGAAAISAYPTLTRADHRWRNLVCLRAHSGGRWTYNSRESTR